MRMVPVLAGACLLRVNPLQSPLAQLPVFTSSTHSYHPIPAKEMELQGVRIIFSQFLPRLCDSYAAVEAVGAIWPRV